MNTMSIYNNYLYIQPLSNDWTLEPALKQEEQNYFSTVFI